MKHRLIVRKLRCKKFFGNAKSLIATALFVIVASQGWGEPQYVSWLDAHRALRYGVTAGVASVLLSALITAVTVMIAIIDRPRLQAISNTRHFPALFRTWFEAIYLLGFTTVGAFVALVADTDQSPKLWLSFLVLALTLLSTSRVARTIRLLKAVCLLAIEPVPAPPVDARPTPRVYTLKRWK